MVIAVFQVENKLGRTQFFQELFLLADTSMEVVLGIHPSQAAQITTLKQDETLIKVLSKYANYANVFLFDLAIKLSKNTGINKYAIELQDGKQLLYGPIYSLGLLELETLKTYIETYLKTGFI